MSYVDSPQKKQKHPHYEHRTNKLDRKDNEFTSKKFHHVRNVSTHKKLIKSFGRIGMRLNDKPIRIIPVGDLDKVCFILINDYEEESLIDKERDLGVGPLNDGYLVGLKHHRLGFKVFYLYNAGSAEFSSYLAFFLKSATKALTVYYSGRGNKCGIEFVNNEVMTKSSIKEIISKNCNNEAHVIFISETLHGGSVFDVEGSKNLISLSVEKNKNENEKENKRSQGIFTYYLCKMIGECPNITPTRLIERMKPSLARFEESFNCEYSNKELSGIPMYSTN
ncbi:hypothetical protein M9Y10_007973 [Tritrichomonas musculus]|uniref:Uncharacterized protein n=1 Tax=Tritrichomonas musculus TaxID=1915356 RepID=A0ABR2J2T7_9EUKA